MNLILTEMLKSFQEKEDRTNRRISKRNLSRKGQGRNPAIEKNLS